MVDSYFPLLNGYQTTIVNGKAKNILVISNLQKNNQINGESNQSQSFNLHSVDNKLNNEKIFKPILTENIEKVNLTSPKKYQLSSSIIFTGVKNDGITIIDGLQSINNDTINDINNTESFDFESNNNDVKDSTTFNNLIYSKIAPMSNFAVETIKQNNNEENVKYLQNNINKNDSPINDTFLSKNLQLQNSKEEIIKIENINNDLHKNQKTTITTINVQNVETGIPKTILKNQLLNSYNFNNQKNIDFDTNDNTDDKEKNVETIYLRQPYSNFNGIGYLERPLIEDVILEECEPFEDYSLSKSIETSSYIENKQNNLELNKDHIQNNLNAKFINSLPATPESLTSIEFLNTTIEEQQSAANSITNNIPNNSKPINNTPNMYQKNYEEIVAQNVIDTAVISGVMYAAEVVTKQIENNLKCSNNFYNELMPSTSKTLNDQNFSAPIKLKSDINTMQKKIIPIEINQSNYNDSTFTQQKLITENERNFEKINYQKNEQQFKKKAKLIKNLDNLMDEYSNISNSALNNETHQIKKKNNESNNFNKLNNANKTLINDARNKFFTSSSNSNSKSDIIINNNQLLKSDPEITKNILNIEINQQQLQNNDKSDNLNILSPIANKKLNNLAINNASQLPKQQTNSYFSDILTVSTTTPNIHYNYNNNNNNNLNNKSPTPSFGSLHRRNLLQNQYQDTSSFSPRTLSRINNINVIIDPIKEKKGLFV